MIRHDQFQTSLEAELEGKDIGIFVRVLIALSIALFATLMIVYSVYSTRESDGGKVLPPDPIAVERRAD